MTKKELIKGINTSIKYYEGLSEEKLREALIEDVKKIYESLGLKYKCGLTRYKKELIGKIYDEVVSIKTEEYELKYSSIERLKEIIYFKKRCIKRGLKKHEELKAKGKKYRSELELEISEDIKEYIKRVEKAIEERRNEEIKEDHTEEVKEDETILNIITEGEDKIRDLFKVNQNLREINTLTKCLVNGKEFIFMGLSYNSFAIEQDGKTTRVKLSDVKNIERIDIKQ